MNQSILHAEVSKSFAAILTQLQAGNVSAAIQLAARGKREHADSSTFYALRDTPAKFTIERDERSLRVKEDNYARDYEAREMRALIG